MSSKVIFVYLFFSLIAMNGTAETVLDTAQADRRLPAEKVGPFYGVVEKRGACVPGPCLPHSSIYPSPDTVKGGPAGYLPNHEIVGFAQLHTQGTGGTPSYGNFLISPQLGLQPVESDHASAAKDELGRCYYYRVRLARYDILCEVAPSHHSALYRFTFPASTNASILIDVARKISRSAALDDGFVTINRQSGTAMGGGTFSGNWNPAPYRLYFCARFSRKPDRVGTWTGNQIKAGDTNTVTAKKPLGAFAQFETRSNEIIYLKIAVSFKSPSQAAVWLDQEIPAWDFDALQEAARSHWNQALSAVDLVGASKEEERRFYSELYHTMVQPRDRTGDEDGWDPHSPFYDDHYTVWDTWKTLFPLMAIIRPDVVRDNINSFIARHARNGYVASAFIQGKEFKVGQGGNDVDNVIADAYVKGIKGVDWEKAYQVLLYDAQSERTENYRTNGFVSREEKTDYSWRLKSGSGTLGFAYNDFCVAQLAKGLGKMNDYRRFLDRSQDWTNVWDPTLQDSGFEGFVRGRHQDGRFASTPARKGYNTDFYEGTCWIYSYVIPQNIPGMVERMGGKQRFIDRLGFALKNKLIDFSNEPSFMTVWWFDAVNRPFLTSVLGRPAKKAVR